MKTRTRTALIVTVMAGWLGGCGAEQPSAPATTSVPVRSAGLKIVMIAKNTTNPIFVSARKGAPNLRKRVEGVKKEAALHPGIQIVGTFNHAETAADAAAEVISAQRPTHRSRGGRWLADGRSLRHG